MTCPSADKLSQYIDDLLPLAEKREIKRHLVTCEACQQVQRIFEDEKDFMKETLLTPTLPDDFAQKLVDELPVYKPKRARKYWKRTLGTVAAVSLALGVTAAFTPGFADFIESLFASETVDTGLHEALKAGLVEQVNLKVSDSGRTLIVEELMVDASRVAFTYKIMKDSGRAIYPQIDFEAIQFSSADGYEIPMPGGGRSVIDDNYGMFQFDLPPDFQWDQFTMHIQLEKIGWKKGNWELVIPVDLTEAKKLTKTIVFEDRMTEQHGIEVILDKMRYTPSLTELSYRVQFTHEEDKRLMAERKALTEKYGKISNPLQSEIGYTIENAAGEIVIANNVPTIEYDDAPHMMQGMGNPLSRGTEWTYAMTPFDPDEPLTFVLDGVYKPIPVEAAITFNPHKVEEQQPSFAYQDATITITSAGLSEQDGKTTFKIMLMVTEDAPVVDQLTEWVVIDGEGNRYRTGGGDWWLDGFDNGQMKRTIVRRFDNLNDTPDELTLALVEVIRYEKLAEPWRVPLN